MRLKDINEYSLEVTKEDFIPVGEDGTLYIEDDNENIYMVSPTLFNFESLGNPPHLYSGDAWAIQLNEGVKNMRGGVPPFDYRRIIWEIRDGKVIIPPLSNSSSKLKFANGGSRGGNYHKIGNNRWNGGTGTHRGGGFFLLHDAVIKEDEFLNWINENPLEVKG